MIRLLCQESAAVPASDTTAAVVVRRHHMMYREVKSANFSNFYSRSWIASHHSIESAPVFVVVFGRIDVGIDVGKQGAVQVQAKGRHSRQSRT